MGDTGGDTKWKGSVGEEEAVGTENGGRRAAGTCSSFVEKQRRDSRYPEALLRRY